MKLNFTLNSDLFENEGLFDKYVKDIKNGNKSLKQVKAIVGNGINRFYNSLIK